MRKFYNKISMLGVDPCMGLESTRKIILLNRISLFLFITVFLMRIILISTGVQEFSLKSIIYFFLTFLIFLIPLLNLYGLYKFNAFFVSVISPIMSLVASTRSQIFNEIISINHYFIPRVFIMGLLVLPLILIDSKQRWMQNIAILVNAICILSYDKVVEKIGVPFDPATVDFSSYNLFSYLMMIPVALIVIAFWFLTNLNSKYENQILTLNSELHEKNDKLEQFNEELTVQQDIITKKNDELEFAKNRIEQINNDLTDSIQYAERIQMSILEYEDDTFRYFTDSFILLKPKSIVSGDFHYFKCSQVNGKDCIVTAAVDCTGHGVPGGFLSMLGVAFLNEIITQNNFKNAADILEQLRIKVKLTLQQNHKKNAQKDGMDISLLVYFPNEKTIDFAGARNSLCIVDRMKNPTLIKGDRQPIGIFEKEEIFTNHFIQLSPNDMLYIFSDGISDQFGGIDGKKLLTKNLINKLVSISELNCSNQKDNMIEFINDWQNSDGSHYYEQVDDIVLIGLRV